MAQIGKVMRTLILYNELIQGKVIRKKEFSREYDISERTFDRDIQEIRNFFSDVFSGNTLDYKEPLGVYQLSCTQSSVLSSYEVLALSLVLIASRGLIKVEMCAILENIRRFLPQKEQERIEGLLRNAVFHYAGPFHQKALLKMIWDFSVVINKREILQLYYQDSQNREEEKIVCPISVIFSEHYYYLIAFLKDSTYSNPAFFRLDRIVSFTRTGSFYEEKLKANYDVGDMRKKLKYMFGGTLIRVKMECDRNLQSVVLDAFPDAKVLDCRPDCCEIEAEVFDEGYLKWFFSFRGQVRVKEPETLRERIRKEAKALWEQYESDE